MALSCINFEIKPNISRKSWFLYPLAFGAPVSGGGFPSEYCLPVLCGKTRMMGLPTVKKVWGYEYSFWQNVRTWQTHRHRMTLNASIARQKKRLLYYNTRSIIRVLGGRKNSTRPVNNLTHGGSSFTLGVGRAGDWLIIEWYLNSVVRQWQLIPALLAAAVAAADGVWLTAIIIIIIVQSLYHLHLHPSSFTHLYTDASRPPIIKTLAIKSRPVIVLS